MSKFELLFPSIVLDLFWCDNIKTLTLASPLSPEALDAPSSRSRFALSNQTRLVIHHKSILYSFSLSYDPHPRPENTFFFPLDILLVRAASWRKPVCLVCLFHSCACGRSDGRVSSECMRRGVGCDF